MKRIINRLPSFDQIIRLYGVITFIAYGWTALAFASKLNSWIMMLDFNEILGIFGYSVVTDLLESILVLAFFLIMAFALPRSLFQSNFASRGGIVLLVSIIWILIFDYTHLTNELGSIGNYLLWGIGLIGNILAVLMLENRLVILRRVMNDFADRTIVFLYVTQPLSMLGLFVIVPRLVL